MQKLKSSKKKKKNQRKVFKIKCDKGTHIGPLFFGQLGDSYMATPKSGQKVKTEFIVSTRKTTVSTILIDPKGRPYVHIDVSLRTLEAFFKQLKKDLPKLRKINKKHKSSVLGCRHLSPDLTFVVRK